MRKIWIVVIIEAIVECSKWAISLLGSVIVNEASTGLPINWRLVFTNKWFWIALILQLIVLLLYLLINRITRKTDEELEEAYRTGEIILLNEAVEQAKRKDFISSKKTIKTIDKLRRRRNRL